MRLCAVALAIAFNAFTMPVKNSIDKFYRFSYSGTNYAQASVENECNWGFGTLVFHCSAFTLACDAINDKACEVIVPESCTVLTATGVRMKALCYGDGGLNLVSISAFLGSEPGNYYVNGGNCVCDYRNKD